LRSASSEQSAGRAHAVLLALGNLALVLMAGCLWVVGYMVAPTLFSMLERERAGEVAGRLFTHVAWVAMTCTALLIVFRRWIAPGLPRWATACLWVILALAALGHFGMRPHMATLKAANVSGRLASEAYRSAFGKAHGISALLYLTQSVLAAALVAGWRRRPGA
jgi:hypothetical protein